MQSKAFRGVRHLLVSTGVIALVLSVAAPAAMADAGAKGRTENKSEHADNAGPGARRVKICHKGRIIEVDDDGQMGGHVNHDDDTAINSDDDGKACAESSDGTHDEDVFIDVCVDGELEQLLEWQVQEAHSSPELNAEGVPVCAGAIEDDVTVCVDGVPTVVAEADENAVLPVTEGGELTCPGPVVVGGDKVQVCHGGSVTDIDAGALTDHMGHGDIAPNLEAAEGAECGSADVVVGKPVVVVDTPIDTVDVVTGGVPATPAQPLPVVQPRPVVVISTDTVTAPVVPATPATPATPDRGNEVLGAVTTRTPSPGVGAPDPGAQTVGAVTALAATGSGSTTVLVIVGLLLLLAGFVLQISAGRVVRAARVGA